MAARRKRWPASAVTWKLDGLAVSFTLYLTRNLMNRITFTLFLPLSLSLSLLSYPSLSLSISLYLAIYLSLPFSPFLSVWVRNRSVWFGAQGLVISAPYYGNPVNTYGKVQSPAGPPLRSQDTHVIILSSKWNPGKQGIFWGVLFVTLDKLWDPLCRSQA